MVTAPKSRVRPHLFAPGPASERDSNGRTACETCHLIGEPGDQRHTLPDAPAWDVQQRRAGEDGDER